MAKIRSRDTMPEIWLRKKLFRLGYRYRKNVNNVLGHPDIWLAKYRTAVFVHGCFWHRHRGCKYAYMPKSRIEFWEEKFQKNIIRDQKIKDELEAANIKVIVVWECTIKKMIKDEITAVSSLKRIEAFLTSVEKYLEI